MYNDRMGTLYWLVQCEGSCLEGLINPHILAHCFDIDLAMNVLLWPSSSSIDLNTAFVNKW